MFITYCTENRLIVVNVLQKTKGEIAEILINFYAELRRKDGELYSRSSMISIRFGLQRFFQKIKYDIINDPDFRLSNEMFKVVLTTIKRTGKGTTQHKDLINDADMANLYSSGILNKNNPHGLQYKVFLDVMFYTCRRGRENLRKMKKTDFVLRTDGQGRRYYLNVAQYETKYHRGSDVNDYDASSTRIFEIPGNILIEINVK